jgi:hypothetical protein
MPQQEIDPSVRTAQEKPPPEEMLSKQLVHE